MNKDVLYIDVEDDITAIITKIKASNEKIIALVPPKRIGALQSAVNLRLLNRAATQAGKRLVIITNNQALAGLAAAASIPVAKNLQSKPEIAEIPALEIDDEDVIDGGELPVGEHAESATGAGDTESDDEVASVLPSVNIDDEAPAQKSTPRSKNTPKAKKIPNFNSFRKKLFIGILALLLLAGTLVWAFVFAPAATVIITAKTTSSPVSGIISLGDTTSVDKGTLKVLTQSSDSDVSVQFTPSGQKDIGNKASGTASLSTNSIANLGTTVPAGTALTASNGLTYYTTSPVTFTINNYSGVPVGIQAADSGEKYNGATGTLSGAPSGVSAKVTDATSGGTSQIVPVVTAADVQAAKEKLVSQSTDDAKNQLTTKFSSDYQVIADSFTVDRSDVVSSPDVGGQATDGKATLKSKVTYKLSGIAKSELTQYLTDALKKQMTDQTTQKVYDSGIASAKLSDYKAGSPASIRLTATGQVGPVINENDIKNEVAGKRFGDVQSELTKINGVSDVEVRFSYFWVNTIPKDTKKITVEFSVQNANKN